MAGQQWLWICTLMLNVLPGLSQCPADRQYHEGACYRAWNSSQLNFTEAENDCVTSGGHLASIPNIRVQRFLESLITTFKAADPEEDLDFWVGLTWDGNSSAYTWTDHSASLYRNWLIHTNTSLNQPLRNKASGGCVTLYHSPRLVTETGVTDLGNWTWGDEDCGGMKAYICRYMSDALCQKALVSGDWAVPVTSLTSSGSLRVNDMTTEGFSILGTEVDLRRGIPTGGWTPVDSSSYDNYLQVDLGTPYVVREVWTQGRDDVTEMTSEWVRSFRLYHSMDTILWTPYSDTQDDVTEPKIFIANSDRNTTMKNILNNPIFARYMRINPQGYKNSQTLRFELFGCPRPPTEDLTSSVLTMDQGGDHYYTTDYLSKGDVVRANTGTLTDQQGTVCKTLPQATFHTAWSYMVFLSRSVAGQFSYVSLLGKGRDLNCLQKTHRYALARPILSIRTLSANDLLYCDLTRTERSADLYTIKCEFFCACPEALSGSCPQGVVVNVMDTPSLESGQEWKLCEVSAYVTL